MVSKTWVSSTLWNPDLGHQLGQDAPGIRLGVVEPVALLHEPEALAHFGGALQAVVGDMQTASQDSAGTWHAALRAFSQRHLMKHQ